MFKCLGQPGPYLSKEQSGYYPHISSIVLRKTTSTVANLTVTKYVQALKI